MEWTVVTVIVVIVGLVISIATPLIKNTKAMTELTVSIRMLNDQVKRMEDHNESEHKELQEQLDHHDDKINNHETRLTLIEKTSPKTQYTS